jgi:uncharacterized membrane protein YdjX (TVP38/TMEM64 family)
MENTTKTSRPWYREHAQKLVALVFWIILFGSYQWYTFSNHLSAFQVIEQILVFLTNSFWGPLIYIALYAVRPLILFPSLVLTLAGGFVFGPVLGVIYTIIAGNISGTVAYLIGRYFGQGLLTKSSSDNLIQRYATRMRQNSFETILIMRFILLPYDLVNYLAGFLKIKWLPFALATALGSIPATIAYVWFGASIERFDGTVPSFNPMTLAASIVIFVVSLVLSRILKKREGISK